MQFIALIYQSEKKTQGFTKDEWGKIYAEYQAVGREMGEKGQLKAGHGLQPVASARTVRSRDGKVVVSEGPCFQTEDQLSGVNLLEAPDLESAVQLAAKFPSARWGSIEVRPLMEYKGSSTETYKN
jgi:hypothetical protein